MIGLNKIFKVWMRKTRAMMTRRPVLVIGFGEIGRPLYEIFRNQESLTFMAVT